MATFFERYSTSELLKLFEHKFLKTLEDMVIVSGILSGRIIFNSYTLSDSERVVYNNFNARLDEMKSESRDEFFDQTSTSDLLKLFESNSLKTLHDMVAVSGILSQRIIFNSYSLTENERVVYNNFNNRLDKMKAETQMVNMTGEGMPMNLHYLNPMGESSTQVKRFNAEGRKLKFAFKLVDNNENPFNWLKNAFQEMIEYAVRGFSPDDRVGMELTNSSNPGKPVGFSFRKVSQLSVDVIMNAVSKILQSNAGFFSTDTLELNLTRVSIPLGRGRSKLTGYSFDEFCLKKHGIVVISNNDNLCLAKALSLGVVYKQNADYFKSIKGDAAALDYLSRKLCNDAGVDLTNGGGYEHLEVFQSYLKYFTIIVYNNRDGSSTYFEGPRGVDRQTINLLLEENHYNLITSLTSAFTTTYYCEPCKKRYSNKFQHKKCKYICPCCHSNPPCKISENQIECSECQRVFRGPLCFTEHKKELCGRIKKCTKCFKLVWRGRTQHRCGFTYCTICKESKPTRHLCFMSKNILTDNARKSLNDFLFIFYDFECTQEVVAFKDKDGKNVYEHRPNLCVAQHVCTKCIKLKMNEKSLNCERCGIGEYVFKENPVKEFLDYVSSISVSFKKIRVIAHNMKGYDGCFILRHILLERTSWSPEIIRTGSKLISITCGKIKFIDSLNFIQLPLSKFPKTFEFEGAKGFFPYLFNTFENTHYVGPLPPANFYNPDEMSTQENNVFYEWYNKLSAENYIFHMNDEILKYCKSDVDILRKACVIFWEGFIAENGVDPFQEATTIASACNLVYRRNYLDANTIGVIPAGGYRFADRQSKAAIGWLMWLERSQNLKIEHAFNGREVRLDEGFLVDGYCRETNTVYEFHGCYYHGCESCFPNQVDPLANDENDFMFIRREETTLKSNRIRASGYNLEEIWECEFRRSIKNHLDLKHFMDTLVINKHDVLNPRDAFYGGRTNAVKLYHKCEPGEKIMYFDVCSLYPYINKYSKYPVGHPTLHIGERACAKLDLNRVEGLIKCTVLPPSNLYHPVLPLKLHGKLLFVLCLKCAETLQQGPCTHSDAERQFSGTYVADELRKAIELGYSVVNVSEVWEYRVISYDRENKSGGLFSGYINNFLKIKQEASGWPSDCKNLELKSKYISDYAEKEGVSLREGKIKQNSGLRFISKLMLNSFWGKLGQKENLKQTTIINQPSDLFKLLTDPSISVLDIVIISDETLLVSWERPDGAIKPSANVNVVLAAYTTAMARLELYSYIEKLGRRILYFDTDSIIFVQKPGEKNPFTGEFLGDMTDELTKDYGEGSYIVEFVSGGPKNYAYVIYSTKYNGFKTICKVKGITLNFKNAGIINFDLIKNLVVNGKDIDTVVSTERQISRTKFYDVVSRPATKRYMLCYTKRRRIVGSYDTLPFGFK